MDEKNRQDPQEENLYDPTFDTQILPDEFAMTAAGLRHPDDVDLDKLIYEAKIQAGMEVPVGEFRDEEFQDTFGGGEEMERIFSQAFGEIEEPDQSEKPAEPEPVSQETQVRKGRPKRKKGYGLLGIPHILATVVWLAVIVAIGVSLGRVIWVCAAEVLAFGREDQKVVVTIENDDTLDVIADKLEEAGLIEYPELFKAYANLTDAREKISSGSFTLNTMYDYMALVNGLRSYSSYRETTTVLIPEGYTCAQTFSLLESKGVCSVEELNAYAAEGELDDFWFLEGVERGTANCLEGFLFPDTYEFYIGDSASNVLDKLLTNFNRRFSDEMKASIDTLNATMASMMRSNGYGDDYIAQNKMTIREVVIVASMIEEETSGGDESYNIASVIYNRLANQKAYPYLNIDAALMYALGHKDALTTEDLQVDSEYNTYTHAGLIPGPISNPGLNSLKAALSPNDTSYYYYVLNPDTGKHVFSKTYDEHLANMANLGY